MIVFPVVVNWETVFANLEAFKKVQHQAYQNVYYISGTTDESFEVFFR